MLLTLLSGPTGATLAPTLFTNSNSFFAPAISGSYTLTPARFANSNSFFTPAVSRRYTLAPALFTNSNLVFSPACYFYPFSPGVGRSSGPHLFPTPRNPIPTPPDSPRGGMPLTSTSSRQPMPI